MFSWICPRCGRENPPSAVQCPNCQGLEQQPQAVPVPESTQATVQQAVPVPPPVIPPAPPEPRQYAPPPPPSPPPPQIPDPLRAPLQHAEPPRRYAPPPRVARSGSGLPTWLLAVVFTFAFLGLGSAVYYGYQKFSRGGPAGFSGGETSSKAPKPKASNALAKYIEVVGIRLTADPKKKPQAKFVVVNHASSELEDLNANVTLWASTSRSEEDSVGTFTFKIIRIGPNESREITTPLKTKLKVYELPDWQNATAEVQITAP